MSREEKRLVIFLLIDIGASILVAPALATKLKWPLWLTYILVALDGILILDVPRETKECIAEVNVGRFFNRRGFIESIHPLTFLEFTIFVIAPIIAFIWFAWQYLS